MEGSGLVARTVPEWIGKNDDARPHQAVRDRVFDRQKGLCAHCGFNITHRPKHLDHIVRLRDGGENREFNLQFLCELCHQNKTSEENTLGAKAARIRARHYGVKEKSAFAKRYAKLKLTWKKDWKTGRMVRRVTELDDDRPD